MALVPWDSEKEGREITGCQRKRFVFSITGGGGREQKGRVEGRTFRVEGEEGVDMDREDKGK